MSKEDVLKVQTCVLKVNIHCDGCEKKVKKILHNINGVYQSRIDADQGKVTVSGLVDPSAVVRKLNRAGKPAALWGYKPGVVNQQYGGGGGKGQPTDAGGKGQHKGGAGDGGGEDAKAVLPLPTPQQLQMKGMMELPPPLTGGKMPFPASSAPAKDPKAVKFGLPEDEFDDDDEGSELDDEFDDFDDGEGFEGDGFDDDDDLDDGPETVTKFTAAVPPGGGKKGGGGGEIPVQIKGNADSGGGGKKDPGGKQNQGRSGGGGQPPQNGRGGGNQPGQGEKGGPTGGMPPPGMTRANMVGGMPQPGAVRPNMMGGAGFPGTGQMGGGPMGRHHPHMGGVQHGGAGAVHGMHAGAGFYQGGGGGMQPVGPEVLQGNPMAQQQYMAMMQQQQQMMLNGGHGGHHGHGAAGYPPMHRYPMMAYPPHADPYNIFSDENPNSSCSVM